MSIHFKGYKRSIPNRPIGGVSFSEVIKVWVVTDQSYDEYGNINDEPREAKFIRASSNPLTADDERAADLQASGVRLNAVREFFTDVEIKVQERGEIEWKDNFYIAIQSADWGTYFSTLAVRKEDQ